MKKTLIIIIIIYFIAGLTFVLASDDFTTRIKGKILLQVENNGEAWYVNPSDLRKYYLGRPADAFSLMRGLSTGITNANLEKISVGLLDSNNADDDGDGLFNSLEVALGTDSQKSDTDNDGNNDKVEIENNYNPLGGGKLNIDSGFAGRNKGKIFLQVEKNGEAWYVNPTDQKRYFLARPADAFDIMRKLSLGITNNDLNQIATGYIDIIDNPENYNTEITDKILADVASAINSNNTEKLLNYYTPEYSEVIKYTMNALNAEEKSIWASNMANAKLISSNENENTYAIEIYFFGGLNQIKYPVRKQNDGSWRLTKM